MPLSPSVPVIERIQQGDLNVLICPDGSQGSSWTFQLDKKGEEFISLAAIKDGDSEDG
jgi:hypothetical protein